METQKASNSSIKDVGRKFPKLGKIISNCRRTLKNKNLHLVVGLLSFGATFYFFYANKDVALTMMEIIYAMSFLAYSLILVKEEFSDKDYPDLEWVSKIATLVFVYIVVICLVVIAFLFPKTNLVITIALIILGSINYITTNQGEKMVTPSPIQDGSEKGCPVINKEQMQILFWFAIITIFSFLFAFSCYFFPKITVVTTIVAAICYWIKCSDKKTLEEAKVELEQK